MRILEGYTNTNICNLITDLEEKYTCFTFYWYKFDKESGTILGCCDEDIGEERHDVVEIIIRYTNSCYGNDYIIQIHDELMAENFSNNLIEYITTNLDNLE